MNLRFKIFFWIGGLFLFGFIIAQILEEMITSDTLLKEEAYLQKTIIAQDELRRQNIERFVRTTLDQEKERMLVLFSKIENYPWLYSRYAPTIENAKKGTWLQSASLIDANKWIDFIQNTNEGFLASQIVIDETNTRDTILVDIDKDLRLCIIRSINDKNAWDGPYIAISYDYEELTYENDRDKQINTSNTKTNGYFLLFQPENIAQLDVTNIKKKFQLIYDNWINYGVIFQPNSSYYKMMTEMIRQVEYAKNYCISNKEFYEKITSSAKTQYIYEIVKEKEDNCKKALKEEGLITRSPLSLRYDQIINNWEISTLLATELFGTEPFSAQFPEGIAQVINEQGCGYSFMNQDILFDQLNISTKKFQGRIGSVPEIAITVFKDSKDRLYFGGALTLTDQQKDGTVRRGTLTLAIDAKNIVRNLSLAANATTFFSSGGQLLTGYSSTGDRIDVSNVKFPLNNIINKNTSFINYNDIEYFCLLIRPYDDIDMNFFILSPKDKEFALITVLNSTAKNLIKKLTDQTSMIVIGILILVLVILNNIIKHITHPISSLVEACEELRFGKLQNIQLPEIKKKEKDEVYTLYQSFKAMILGLKEKEKVMGVLNKVVSPSIAQEILKGKVHLGGEEKIVTVFFADIRNFTKITEKMAPHEVINILNTCMTRISEIIDRHHGVIDKYVGDEVMALFGAPLHLDNAPMMAIDCALEIHESLRLWNEERSANNLPKVEMGIGVHTGNVLAGNMGAENRLNYTVLGANVNLAARVCSIAKANEILVTTETVQISEILEEFVVEALPPTEVKGFSETINVFKILGHKKKTSM